MSSSLSEKDGEAERFLHSQTESEHAAAADKQTDDPRLVATTDGSGLTPSSEPIARTIGEYEVLERLGSGGMGEVYKARHRRLNKIVALKLLPAESRDLQKATARFQREMEAVGALDHPNVVEAHDAGEQSGVVYLAMKLIDGVDLRRLVEQRGPLPIGEACELVRQAALGLHYLHQRGLVHRDVKPSNMMRTPSGAVKVLDLGLARWCLEVEEGHDLTGMGQVMGTPDYLAPEQVESAAEADARADLYGLGGTLFYLLTGRAPFADHKTRFSKLEAHRREAPPDVRTLRPEAPAKLAALLQRLLAKKPEERYRTAAEVAAALELSTENPQVERVEAAEGTALATPVSVDGNANRRGKRKLTLGLTVGHWSCSLTLAVGMAAAVLVGLPVWWMLDPASRLKRDPGSNDENRVANLAEPPAPPVQSKVPLPREMPPGPDVLSNLKESINVKKLEVWLTRNVEGHGQPAGLLGEKVFDPHQEDTVTIRAQLSRPAYAYLIAFQPNGKADVCFPEEKDEAPALTDHPRYPSKPVSAAKVYAFNDGAGLQAFAVVVSRQPLPSFEDWWTPRSNECPWKPENAMPGIVYRANGEDAVEAWNEVRAVRGKGVEAKDKKPLAQLAKWLREQPGVETVQVFGFAVAPRAKD